MHYNEIDFDLIMLIVEIFIFLLAFALKILNLTAELLQKPPQQWNGGILGGASSCCLIMSISKFYFIASFSLAAFF